MKLLRVRLSFIIIGISNILFSNNIYNFFYSNYSETFQLIKTFSFIILGLVLVLIGLFFDFESYFIR